jgi:uncharacterized membrane protein YfcA
VNRLTLAMAAFVVLGVLAWTTLSDERLRLVTLAILALFAAKTWVRRNDVMHPDNQSEQDAAEVDHEEVLPRANG